MSSERKMITMKKTNKIIAVMSAVLIAGIGTASFSILTAQADNDISEISESIAEETTAQNNSTVANYFEMPETTVNLKVAPQNITDQKTLLTMIINSIDYFNTASGTFRETVLGQEHKTDFATDMINSVAYEKMDLGDREVEVYTQNGRVLEVDNTNGTVESMGFTAQRDNTLVESPSPDIFEYNITTDEQGIPTYIGREEATCLSASRMVVQPTEISFNLLADFSNWEITGYDNYLGRDCINVKGIANSYASEKFNVATFELKVDAKTGILLSYEGYGENGELNDYMIVDEIHIDEQDMDIKQEVTQKFKQNVEQYKTFDGYDDVSVKLMLGDY